MNTDVMFVNEDLTDNWFYNRYYYAGANARYFTFQMCLNLLYQRKFNREQNAIGTVGYERPVIIETGCQREEEDIGAGMSTSIFAEFVQRYGGKVIAVDNSAEHLGRCRRFMRSFPEADVELCLSDSVKWLGEYNGPCDLLYLDSLDYPIGDNEGNIQMQKAAQEHNLNEFLAVEDRLSEDCILLLDDNLLEGGGKPRLLKDYLLEKGWTCLLDYQQSLWVREL